MKTRDLVAAMAVTIYGCNRAPDNKLSTNDPAVLTDQATTFDQGKVIELLTGPEQYGPKQHLPTNISTATEVQIETRARELIIRDPATGTISEENIAALVGLIPKLQALDVFWKWVSAVPPAQRAAFRDTILSSLRALRPIPGQPVDSQFRNAYGIARDLRDPEVARIALEQLPLVEPYRFPSTPPPRGWPEGTPQNMERLAHGNQGVLATTVVKMGDQPTLKEFRAMLKTEPPDAQRTLIWALGQSSEIADFELLMTLQARASNPEVRDTIVRALNRIPQSMEVAASAPGTIPKDRRPLDVAKLLETAAQCKARLVALGLTVETTLYD